jgi:hypothetical protein
MSYIKLQITPPLPYFCHPEWRVKTADNSGGWHHHVENPRKILAI